MRTLNDFRTLSRRRKAYETSAEDDFAREPTVQPLAIWASSYLTFVRLSVLAIFAFALFHALKPTLKLSEHFGESRVLHLLKWQPMGLKRSVSPHIIGDQICFVARGIVRSIVEKIDRSNKLPVSYLKSRCDGTWRAIKASALCVFKRDRHDRAIMTTSHPATDEMWERPGFQHLAQGWQSRLRPHKRHWIVFTHVFARDFKQLFGAHCCDRFVGRQFAPFFWEYPLYDVAALCAD